MKIQMIRAISERSTRAMSKKVAAIGLPLLVGAITVVAGPAGSALAASSTTLTDVATLFCLDSNGNGNVYTGGCNGGNYQNWVMQPTDSNSDFRLVNAQTGRCLDSNASGSVYTMPCNGGNYQNWHVSPASGTPNQIQDVSTLFCLDSNTSGSVYTLGCNGGNFQRWLRSS